MRKLRARYWRTQAKPLGVNRAFHVPKVDAAVLMTEIVKFIALVLGVLLGLGTLAFMFVMTQTDWRLNDIQFWAHQTDWLVVTLGAVALLVILIPPFYVLWKRVRIWNTFGERFLREDADKYPIPETEAIGPVRIGPKQFYRLACSAAHKSGISLRKAFPILAYKAMLIPWKEVEAIRFFEVAVDEKFGQDYQGLATVSLVTMPELELVVPWRAAFDDFVPDSVGLNVQPAFGDSGS